MTLKELIEIMKDNGISGAGGAGFPSYAKLNEKADTIILNCAECEPLLKVHRQVLKHNAFEIMSGLKIISEAVGAKRCIVAIKPSYITTVQSVKDQLDAFPNIEIGFLPEVYPAGDEVIAIYETTGRVVPPGSLPISVGCIVFNVETVLNVYRAVELKAPVTHKHVTVAGEINTPSTICAPLGTSFLELISLAGGAKIDDYSLICGGPMTGFVANPTDVVTKTTNAIIVLPKNHPVIIKKQIKPAISAKRIMASCCQCRACTDLCSRNLLGHPIEPHEIMRTITSGKVVKPQVVLNSAYCSGCGICELYACPQSLHPREIILSLKAELRKNKVQLPKIENFDPVSPNRDLRKIPKHRLTARLGLTKYNLPAPLYEKSFDVKSVKILFSQHAGAPAEPLVKIGDEVKAGQKIAQAKNDALSLNIHASISGKVTQVCEKYAVIKKMEVRS